MTVRPQFHWPANAEAELEHVQSLDLAQLLVKAPFIIGLCLLYQFGPEWIQLGDNGQHLWSLVGWVVAPLLAAVVCFLVSRPLTGHDQKAWQSFANGSLLWACGTLAWEFIDGMEFPGLADVAYIGTCLFYLRGTFHYTAHENLLTRIQASNFVLVQSAIAIIALVIFYQKWRFPNFQIWARLWLIFTR